MPAPRRLAALLASGIVALGAAGPAFAQGTDRDGAAAAAAQAQGAATIDAPPPLTPEPQAPGAGLSGGSDKPGSGGTDESGSGDSGSKRQKSRTLPKELKRSKSVRPDASSAASEPSASGVARIELPNTGADAGVVGVLGAVLMLLGIGLRLRVADVRL